MNITLQLLSEHPDIHYYQGLHDIVLTFVLAVGDTLAYAIMDILVEYHLRYTFISCFTTLSVEKIPAGIFWM